MPQHYHLTQLLVAAEEAGKRQQHMPMYLPHERTWSGPVPTAHASAQGCVGAGAAVAHQ
jgi:hypothetical protein